jgi:hypothetical protein
MYRGHRKECTEAIAKNVQRPSQRTYRGHRKECTEAIAKKNISRNKYLQKGTRANQEQYTQTRKEANETYKGKKKQWLNNRIKQIEEAHKMKQESFKDIRTFQNDRSPATFTCKDENGT